MLRSRPNSKSLGNHVVSPGEEKERLQWEGLAEKESFTSGMKERVGDGKLIIICITVSGINELTCCFTHLLYRVVSRCGLLHLDAMLLRYMPWPCAIRLCLSQDTETDQRIELGFCRVIFSSTSSTIEIVDHTCGGRDATFLDSCTVVYYTSVD